MLTTLQSGGWLMAPILACSIVAAGIAIERWWMLRRSRVLPGGLAGRMAERLRRGRLDAPSLDELTANSPLGRVLAAGAANAGRGREPMKEAMREAVDQAYHDLQRYLTSLGIIASVAPLLGLLGTVIGMIEVFGVLMLKGSGDAQALAGGIARALVTTAAGLSVAIPALMCHRYFLRRVDDLALDMEQQAARFVDIAHGQAADTAASGS